MGNTELQDLIAKHGTMVSYPVAAEICTVSARTLKRLTANGDLPCYRIGRSKALRVKTADVYGLIQRVA